MTPGKFIVVEGPDGSGHSTQAALLIKFLQEHGKKALITREPTTESAAGGKIREVVDDKTATLSPKELQELFVQDRAEHVERVILPKLQEGIWVVCDRYLFSTIAYGAAEGVEREWLTAQNSWFPLPDCSLFIMVRPDVSLERALKRGRPLSIFETREKLKRIEEEYQMLSKRFPSVHIINGEQTIEEVAHDVQNVIQKNLL